MQKPSTTHLATFRVFRTGRCFFNFRFTIPWLIKKEFNDRTVMGHHRSFPSRNFDFDIGARLLTGIFGSWRLDVAFGFVAISFMHKWMTPPERGDMTGISFFLIPKSWEPEEGLVYHISRSWCWRRMSIYPSFREQYELFKSTLCRDKIVRIHSDGSSEVIAEVKRGSPYDIKGV